MPRRNILERLSDGHTFLLDGGTGSQLQRRGADVLKGSTDVLKAWSATGPEHISAMCPVVKDGV